MAPIPAAFSADPLRVLCSSMLKFSQSFEALHLDSFSLQSKPDHTPSRGPSRCDISARMAAEMATLPFSKQILL